MAYLEGILWYLLALDCLLYLIMTSTHKKHHQSTHWLSEHFPLNYFFALFYGILTAWLGFTLYRMQLI